MTKQGAEQSEALAVRTSFIVRGCRRMQASLSWRWWRLRQAVARLERLAPDKYVIQHQFKEHFGRSLNLRNPQTFNEKLQWIKLFYRDAKLCALADKYEVRKYVSDVVGQDYLTRLHGVWSSPEDIDLDELPHSFVLKTTTGSGTNIIVRDKSSVDWRKARDQLAVWLKANHYWYFREWAYKDIAPRVIAEELLVDSTHLVPPDYKIHVFGGQPRSIQLIEGRYADTSEGFYTPDWEFLPCTYTFPRMKTPAQRPKLLDRMCDIAARLAVGMPYCRVDLYQMNEERIVFGEMTLYPTAGYDKWTPDEWDLRWGEYLILPPKHSRWQSPVTLKG